MVDINSESKNGLSNEWILRIGKDRTRSIDASGSLVEAQNIILGNKGTAIKEAERRAKIHLKKAGTDKAPFYLLYNMSGRLAVKLL